MQGVRGEGMVESDRAPWRGPTWLQRVAVTVRQPLPADGGGIWQPRYKAGRAKGGPPHAQLPNAGSLVQADRCRLVAVVALRIHSQQQLHTCDQGVLVEPYMGVVRVEAQ